MFKKLRALLDWIGTGQTVQGLLQSLWAAIPLSWLGGTGVAGYMTDQPIMWIMVAMAASGSLICVGMLAASLLSVWKNPQHKLRFVSANLGIDFAKTRAQGNKKIEKAQLLVQIRNDAHYPLSMFLEKADSSVEGLRPPRGEFPKKPTIVGPSAIVLIGDDTIDMGNRACSNLTGELDYHIRYGHPGREKYLLPIKGGVSVQMDTNGTVRNILFLHSTEDIRLLPASH